MGLELMLEALDSNAPWAPLGYFTLRDAPELLTLSVLTITGGALTSVVIEEMVPEAHDGEGKEPRLAVLALVGGFALFAAISVHFGG